MRPLREDELDGDVAGLFTAALANLAAVPTRWRDDLPGFTEGLLGLLDVALAAERVLDRPFLQEAHRILGAPRLLATIPRRGYVALANPEDSDAVEALRWLSEQEWIENREDRLTRVLFEVADGEVAGPHTR